MEPVFLHFNLLTLVAFQYLVVTSDLPLGAYCTESKSLSRAAFSMDSSLGSSTNYHANISHDIRKPLSTIVSSNNEHNPVLYSSLSSSLTSSITKFSKPSTDTSSTSEFQENLLVQVSPSTIKSKPTRSSSRNAERKDTHLIFTKNNTRNSSSANKPPSSYTSSSTVSFYPDKRQDEHNGISASTKSNPRRSSGNAFVNVDYKQIEKTTTALEGEQGAVSSSGKSKLVLQPPAKSSVKFAFSYAKRHNEKVATTAGADPFPVAYLINSRYTLESPSVSAKSLDQNDEGDGTRSEMIPTRNLRVSNDRSVLRLAGSINSVPGGYTDNDVGDSSAPNLAMLLQSDGITSNHEISPDMTTLSSAVPEQQEEANTPSSSKDLGTSTSSDNEGGTYETTDEDKSVLNNQTVGTTPLRGKCNDTIQCFGEHVECRLGICKCELGYLPRVDNGELCGEASAHHVEVPTTDPTMIGVVVGLALMSVTLCIVLRLFAKARFRENRTIFNTPNPRLMNVSLLKGSKTLLRGNSAGGQRSRRGSQVSMASGQIEGQSPTNATPDGNGAPEAAASSSHPKRIKPSRTLSTDTTNLEGTPTSSRPMHSGNRSKFRQDSVASNV